MIATIPCGRRWIVSRWPHSHSGRERSRTFRGLSNDDRFALKEPASVGERQDVAAENFDRWPADFGMDGGAKIVGRVDEQMPECPDRS